MNTIERDGRQYQQIVAGDIDDWLGGDVSEDDFREFVIDRLTEWGVLINWTGRVGFLLVPAGDWDDTERMALIDRLCEDWTPGSAT